MICKYDPGSLSGGSGSVSVDASTGLATVTGLSFNAQGRYFLKFDFTSTPGDYDFSSGAQTHLDVYNAGELQCCMGWRVIRCGGKNEEKVIIVWWR